jgi:hypothetical protein
MISTLGHDYFLPIPNLSLILPPDLYTEATDSILMLLKKHVFCVFCMRERESINYSRSVGDNEKSYI